MEKPNEEKQIHYSGDYVRCIEQRNEMLTTFINHSETGMYVTDYHTGVVLFANSKMVSMGGNHFRADDLIGKTCWKLMGDCEDGRCSFCPYEKLLTKDGIPAEQHTWEQYFPSHGLWLKIISKAIIWTDGRLAQMNNIYDITELKAIEEKLSALAFMDHSLQLFNGTKLEQDVMEAMVKPSLIILDIVSLQKINDLYGRTAGSLLLREIRDWICAQNIPNSVLYRVGGDEFCIAVQDISPDKLTGLAEMILARFSEPWIMNASDNRMDIFCGLTIGVIRPEYMHDDDTLLNLIERILKAAKANGNVTVYSEKMDKEFKKRLNLEFSLKRCVRDAMTGFTVYYQPVADPVTGIWCGLEALCRWDSPELGSVSPGMFIPEAERLSLIGTIGLWVLETAVWQCKDWGLDQHNKFILDVNVSAVQFADSVLADKILHILEKYDFPPKRLCLEITESTQFTFSDLSLLTIETLRGREVLVSLDDFGTGYSSFNNLKSLPVDMVKIERVFVANIENDSYLRYLFNAMAELAHTVGMKLIAEGVESKAQMDILLKSGADLLQGYLFSKPIPPEEMKQRLNRFYDIDEAFNFIRRDRIDVKAMLDTQSDTIITPALHKIMNQCTKILLHYDDLNSAINRVLEIVGLHMDVSRTYVFLHIEGDIYCNSHEWCGEQIHSEKETLSRIPIPDSWVQSFKRDGVIIANDISTLAEDVYETLDAQSIKAITVIPLWDGSLLTGFIGIDDCKYYRDWRSEEIVMLHNLCAIIASALNKLKMQQKIDLQGEILSKALNHVNMLVYVSDIETGEILFANDCIKKSFADDVVGRICWEVLQGRNQKCDFCRNDMLLKNPELNGSGWICYNPVTKKRYRVYDSLIPWIDNKLVHLEYALEEDFVETSA